MPISTTPILERIARFLAGMQLSGNADGVEQQAGRSVDMQWTDHVPAALAILKTMREPDEEMARAGHVDVWDHMITVAIREAELNPTSFP